MAVDLKIPDTGCCGMAGPFGFEKENYSSRRHRRASAASAVRALGTEALIVSNGFSCREQILPGYGTTRTASR